MSNEWADEAANSIDIIFCLVLLFNLFNFSFTYQAKGVGGWLCKLVCLFVVVG
jgi:hypothetical protein